MASQEIMLQVMWTVILVLFGYGLIARARVRLVVQGG